jgi:hypothetical protein
MFTLFEKTSGGTAPLRPCAILCESPAATAPEQPFEAILAQAEAKDPMDVPGRYLAAADCCRTWICPCTRAVPHGSFL